MAEINTLNSSIYGQSTSTSVYIKLAIFTALMALLPLGSFFISQQMFIDKYGYDHNQANIRSAIVAVIAAHIVIGLFVYVAWKEDSKDNLKKKE